MKSFFWAQTTNGYVLCAHKKDHDYLQLRSD